MIKTNDIYYKVDEKLLSNDFWNNTIYGKKKLMKTAIEEYTISKVEELGLEDYENKVNLYSKHKLFNLLDFLDSNIAPEDKDEFFRYYTHYILNVSSNIQGYAIVWYQEADEIFIKTPVLEIENDVWESLKTHKDTDPLYVTKLVMMMFFKRFGIKKIECATQKKYGKNKRTSDI